jgi:hypothetical protein
MIAALHSTVDRGVSKSKLALHVSWVIGGGLIMTAGTETLRCLRFFLDSCALKNTGKPLPGKVCCHGRRGREFLFNSRQAGQAASGAERDGNAPVMLGLGIRPQKFWNPYLSG